MNKFRTFLSVALLLLFSFGFASCDKNDDDNGTTVEESKNETFTVTFSTDGGSEVASQTIEKGKTATKPHSDPTKNGFRFVGWYQGDEMFNFSTVITSSIELTAKWVQLFTVTFATDGGSEVAAQRIEDGKTATMSATYTIKDGFALLGWYNGENKFNFETPISDDITLTAKWVKVPENCIPGVFSVSADKKVFFANGNLQYDADNKKFQFAEHQYDFIGESGANISDEGIRDLFGYGTWLEGGNPMNNSKNDEDYAWDNTKSSAMGEEWITLSYKEYMYLVARDNELKCGVAEVNGVQGLILLPDEWVLPEGITFKAGGYQGKDQWGYTIYGSQYYKIQNEYNLEQWSKMENAGAVFFPAGGYRIGLDYDNRSCHASIWSSTSIRTLRFYSSGVEEYREHSGTILCSGNFVRLVRILQN